MKLEMVIWPTWAGLVWPCSVTDTVPSWAMVTVRASWGMVIWGSRVWPLAVTRLPFWSRLKEPSRV